MTNIDSDPDNCGQCNVCSSGQCIVDDTDTCDLGLDWIGETCNNGTCTGYGKIEILFFLQGNHLLEF